MLDGDLDVELRARLCEVGTQMREGDVFLEQRRPAAARGVAGLLVAGIDRHAGAPGARRQARGEADFGVEALERRPIDLDADELPLRPGARLRGERLAADEALLLQVHGPAEIELVGARGLAFDERLSGRHVVDVDQHQPGLDARHVERQHAGGHDTVRGSCLHQCIPNTNCFFGGKPNLVAQITGIAGAANRHGHTKKLRLGKPEIL